MICYQCVGTTRCVACRGTGHLICMECNGVGTKGSSPSRMSTDCSCNGLGTFVCLDCHGTRLCSICNGTGQLIRSIEVSRSQITQKPKQTTAFNIALDVTSQIKSNLAAAFGPGVDSVDIDLRFAYTSVNVPPVTFPEIEEPIQLLNPPQRFTNNTAAEETVPFEAKVGTTIVHAWVITSRLADPNPPIVNFPPVDPSDPFAPSNQLNYALPTSPSPISVPVSDDAKESIPIPPQTNVDVVVNLIRVPVSSGFNAIFTAVGNFDFTIKRGDTTISSTRPALLGDHFRALRFPTVTVVDDETISIACGGTYSGAVVRRFDVVTTQSPITTV